MSLLNSLAPPAAKVTKNEESKGGRTLTGMVQVIAARLRNLEGDGRPTFFFGVPRVWEKMMDAMKAKSANNSPAKIKIAIAAKELCLKRNMGLAESGGRATAGPRALGQPVNGRF